MCTSTNVEGDSIHLSDKIPGGRFQRVACEFRRLPVNAKKRGESAQIFLRGVLDAQGGERIKATARGTMSRVRQALVFVAHCYVGTGRSACATERQRRV